MIWIVLLIVLIAIFGIGTVLEAAFWTLLIFAAAALLIGVLISRALA